MELPRVIQAPMLGVTSPEMVAAANCTGALGSLPVGDMGTGQIAALLGRTRALTDLPFAVNVFVNECPGLTTPEIAKYERVRDKLAALALDLGLAVQFPTIEECVPEPLANRLSYLLESGITVLSFTFGMLPRGMLDELRASSVYIIGSCTNRREMQQLVKSGVDAVCLQSAEAGGHRATFTSAKERVMAKHDTELFKLISLCTAPVYYAGGVNSPGKLNTYFSHGAYGIQMGSELLCTKESLLTDREKQKVSEAAGTELMHCFSGRYARGVMNRFYRLFEETSLVLPYPYQNKLTAPFRKAALNAGLLDYTNIWRGAAEYKFSTASTYDVLKPYVEAVEKLIVTPGA